MAFALMAVVVFNFPEVFSNTGRKVEPISLFGQHLDKPFTLLGINFSESAGFLLFATFLFCLVGFGVVALRRGRFGRRLVAMRDSPAACATLGVNLLATKLAVFGLSAAIAGFAGAIAGVHFGNIQTTNFDLLMGLEGAGLAVLLLLVVGGVGVVSGAVFGSTVLLLFTKFLPIVWFANVKPVQWWSKVGPGLAGVGIASNPEGVIPQVGHDVREKRRVKAAAVVQAAPREDAS
jgi:branched-chain amino acid transport system permease protein